MSAYLLSNFRVGNVQKNLALANDSVANTAARLSSGMRVTSGKFGAADLAQNDLIKGEVAKLAAEARGVSWDLAAAQKKEAFADGVQALVARAVEAMQTYTQLAADAVTGLDQTTYLKEINAMLAEAQTLATAGGLTTIAISSTYTTNADIASVRAELNDVTAGRAAAGAAVASLEYKVAALESNITYQDEAQARFIGIDYAVEAANMTKSQILQQAAAAMVAQVNQSPNVILALFK